MKQPRLLTYQSVVWDLAAARPSTADLKVLLYARAGPRGLIVWLPGMSDKPLADSDNPLLASFVPQALDIGLSIAVVCFPGTFDRRFIEERTLSTMKQNVLDASISLSENISNFSSLKKILIGRSAGGTLVGSLVGTGFDLGISVAGRLKLRELYCRIRTDRVSYPKYYFGNRVFYQINSLKPFLRAAYPVGIDQDQRYCLNEQYVKELGREEKLITQTFQRLKRKKRQIPLLAIQAKDDNVVPFQLLSWKRLAQSAGLPITLCPLSVPCQHSFISRSAIRFTTSKMLSFIQKKGFSYAKTDVLSGKTQTPDPIPHRNQNNLQNLGCGSGHADAHE